ncbi:MAG: sensor histidine kinase [Clostridia bacterium]|nr:sensor histidine kinase [Clostridia bacterium]
MKNRGSMRFISTRVFMLLAVLSLLCLSAAICLAVVLPGDSTVYAAGSLALVLLGTLIVFYLTVLLPYRRAERLISLFLDGYTPSGIAEGGAGLTPSWNRLILRVQEELSAPYLLQLSKRQAQFRALQNQINPHFLYNTLESIRSEALIGGLESVADMTEALAVFFRYTISKDENLVTVEEELQNCRTYFHIQQYRFGERLALHIDCDEADKDLILRCRLPKLTLQPILENGVIHGTECKMGQGKLTVRLDIAQGRLRIRVSDDGVGMDEKTLMKLNERLGRSGRAFSQEQADTTGGVALVNVNNRIHLLFGEEFGLHVYSMVDRGTDVHITLPVMTNEREAGSGAVV